MKWLEMLNQLMVLLGAKLPQAWPHLLAIYTHLAAIATIINGDNVPSAMARGAAYQGEGKKDADSILKLARLHGLNTEEAKLMVNGMLSTEALLAKKTNE